MEWLLALSLAFAHRTSIHDLCGRCGWCLFIGMKSLGKSRRKWTGPMTTATVRRHTHTPDSVNFNFNFIFIRFNSFRFYWVGTPSRRVRCLCLDDQTRCWWRYGVDSNQIISHCLRARTQHDNNPCRSDGRYNFIGNRNHCRNRCLADRKLPIFRHNVGCYMHACMCVEPIRKCDKKVFKANKLNGKDTMVRQQKAIKGMWRQETFNVFWMNYARWRIAIKSHLIK